MCVFVFGHRRSGNHFVMETLKNNFIIEKIIKSHQFFEDGLLKPSDAKLLVVRDGRDALTSCYYWWKSVKGSRKHLKDKKFSQFIKGRVPPIKGFKQNKYITSPIDMWVSYMEGWVGKIPMIKFEDLKTNPIITLEKVETDLALSRKNSKFKPVIKLVGYSPRKGAVGDWKNHFRKEDTNLFWSKAGHIMHKLGYER